MNNQFGASVFIPCEYFDTRKFMGVDTAVARCQSENKSDVDGRNSVASCGISDDTCEGHLEEKKSIPKLREGQTFGFTRFLVILMGLLRL